MYNTFLCIYEQVGWTRGRLLCRYLRCKDEVWQRVPREHPSSRHHTPHWPLLHYPYAGNPLSCKLIVTVNAVILLHLSFILKFNRCNWLIIFISKIISENDLSFSVLTSGDGWGSLWPSWHWQDWDNKGSRSCSWNDGLRFQLLRTNGL